MIDEPVPTMPLMVPASSPTARTKRKFKVLFPANRKHRSPDGAQRNPGLARRRSRIALRCIRATAYLRAQETASVIRPSGGFLTGLSSLISDFPKDISVPTHPKSDLELFASHPTRGAFRERHGRGEGCGGRGSVLRAMDGRAGWRKARERSQSERTRDVAAHGEVVWS